MPTQFEIINHKLDTILTILEDQDRTLRAIAKVAGGWDQLDLDEEVTPEYEAEMRSQTGEDLNPFYGREHEAPAPDVKPRYSRVDSPGEGPPSYRPSATRTHVEVRNPETEDGIEMVPWSDVDERIIEAVRLSSEMGEPWELWRDPTGMIRVSVEASVAHRIRKENTYQQPVPRSGGIPQDMDVDEAARRKE